MIIVPFKEDGGAKLVKNTFPSDQETLAGNYGFKLSKLACQARNLVRDLDP